MNYTKNVSLEPSELLLLDSKCRPEIQKEIDNIKEIIEIESKLGDIYLAEIILKSIRIGTFERTSKMIAHCKLCDRRSDRRKPRKNQMFGEQIPFGGFAFNEGFVTFQNMGDVCDKCNAEKNITGKLIDFILDSDLKIEIIGKHNRPTKYKKDDLRICYSCKKEIYESEMKKLPAMMGGSYPGGCPHCKAESRPFGKQHECSDKYRHIEVLK